jgi:hypothetical protein
MVDVFGVGQPGKHLRDIVDDPLIGPSPLVYLWGTLKIVLLIKLHKSTSTIFIFCVLAILCVIGQIQYGCALPPIRKQHQRAILMHLKHLHTQLWLHRLNIGDLCLCPNFTNMVWIFKI